MKDTVSNHLKEFIQSEAQGVYVFGMTMGLESDDSEWMSDIFADFASRFRSLSASKGFVWEPMEFRILLYSATWRSLRPLLSSAGFERFSILGRDTRQVRRNEADLFLEKNEEFQSQFIARLRFLDLDHRVLIVLRDILGFTDEETMRVTDLRWGVYRHRLHRGRMELGATLRGGDETARALNPVRVS